VLVFHDLKDIAARTGSTSVAIGNFDGVHLGHQALISAMLEKAHAEKLCPTVLTFYPHPVEVLKPHKKLERLTTTSEKLELLEKLGVEQVLVARFDETLSQLSPDVFFESYLNQGLRAKSIHVGFNFVFGKDRGGDIGTLKNLGERAGVFVEVEEQVNSDGERVSSSGIRKLLVEGNVAKASRHLGRPYTITGQVVRGDQRGRKIGFPTANLRCPLDKIAPANGVYFTRVLWQQEELRAVTNVGVRPTFTVGEKAPVIEVHILDFDSDIYEEFLSVEFLGRIREEKKFSGMDELKSQIEQDIAVARRSF
jgi:riboflavin kinase/FMN adenylyltransferase